MYTLEFYKQRKKELKLTNQKIAEISGIPKRTIEDFFCGASQDPRISTVQAIERALGLDNLYRPEGGSDTIKKEVTPEQDEILNLFEAIEEQHGKEFVEKTKSALWALVKENKI